MAAQPTPSGADISVTAKAEGGPAKGSSSAQMQSEVGKTRNFEQAAQEVGSKLQNNPGSVTSEDASYVHSREARATGQQNPPADSITADVQHQAAVNEGATSGSNAGSAPLPPHIHSQMDKEANFQEAAAQVGSKLQSDPASISKEEADLLHRREHRAHGATEKGGIAAQAQSAASRNQK